LVVDDGLSRLKPFGVRLEVVFLSLMLEEQKLVRESAGSDRRVNKKISNLDGLGAWGWFSVDLEQMTLFEFLNQQGGQVLSVCHSIEESSGRSWWMENQSKGEVGCGLNSIFVVSGEVRETQHGRPGASFGEGRSQQSERSWCVVRKIGNMVGEVMKEKVWGGNSFQRNHGHKVGALLSGSEEFEGKSRGVRLFCGQVWFFGITKTKKGILAALEKTSVGVIAVAHPFDLCDGTNTVDQLLASEKIENALVWHVVGHGIKTGIHAEDKQVEEPCCAGPRSWRRVLQTFLPDQIFLGKSWE